MHGSKRNNVVCVPAEGTEDRLVGHLSPRLRLRSLCLVSILPSFCSEDTANSPGAIISIKILAAVSTLPVRWAQSYQRDLISRVIGSHLSFLNEGEILSKNLHSISH